jgi:hypothetical protein
MKIADDLTESAPVALAELTNVGLWGLHLRCGQAYLLLRIEARRLGHDVVLMNTG